MKTLHFTPQELQMEETDFRKLIASHFGIAETSLQSYSMEFLNFSDSRANYLVHVSAQEGGRS